MNKNFLKNLVKDRRLTVNERLSGRLGYMGTAFIMIGPYILSYGDIGAISRRIQIWIGMQICLTFLHQGNGSPEHP